MSEAYNFLLNKCSNKKLKKSRNLEIFRRSFKSQANLFKSEKTNRALTADIVMWNLKCKIF